MRRDPVGPGQESVWDYPRPPRVEPVPETVQVVLGGRVLAETRRALRTLETSHPPVYYVPMADVVAGRLTPGRGTTFCEYKGRAVYWDAEGVEAVGWSYPEPSPGYEQLADHVAFYPGRVDQATVGGEVVTPQEGGFYGGWITARVVGPFKGAPGTTWW